MTPQMVADAETLFQTRMQADFPNVPIFFSNTPIPDTQGVYAQIFVVSGDTFPINLGITAKSRNVGIIQISVVGPKDQGAGATHDIAYAAGRFFRRKSRNIGTEGHVVYKDPTVKDMELDDGKHIYAAMVPYRYDFVDQ